MSRTQLARAGSIADKQWSFKDLLVDLSHSLLASR
jgi:hypothetical protein